MANSIAKLAILLTTDASGVGKGFAQAKASVQQFGASLSSMAAQLGLITGAAGAAGFVGWGVKLAADAEQAEVGFRVMLGSAEKAKTLLSEIKQFALSSPFGESGLQFGAKQLLQFQVAGENVMPMLRMMGDISLGSQEGMDGLSRVFGQVAVAGRLLGQDLNQMRTWGFDPLPIIAKRTGESLAEVSDRQKEGAVTAREFAQALVDATSKGGHWHNMMKEMEGTTTARWQKLTEEFGQLAKTLGVQLLPAINSVVKVGSQLVSWLGTIDRATVVWLGSIGAAIMLAPRIIGAIKAIVGAFRAMATAQAIQQALSGPGGWLTLVTGLGIAAGAALTINAAFDKANTSLAKHSTEAQKAANATKKLNVELFAGAAPDTSAADAAAKRIQDMQRAGEQLANSLRTPFEKIRDDLAQAYELLQAGAISAEVYARAQAKAREDLAAQAESADQIRNRLQAQNRPVAAAQYGTNAAFSMLNAASTERKIQAELQKQMVNQQKDTNDKLRRIENAIKAKEGVTVNEVTL